jgi:hypothetical protein
MAPLCRALVKRLNNMEVSCVRGANACAMPGIYCKGWLRQTFVVLPDLSGPDPGCRGLSRQSSEIVTR